MFTEKTQFINKTTTMIEYTPCIENKSGKGGEKQMGRKWKWNKRKWRLPVLKLRFRIPLYAAAIVFAGLSFFQVGTGAFSPLGEIMIYVCAAGTVFMACVYIGPDIKAVNTAAHEWMEYLADRYQRIRRFLRDYRFRTFITTSVGLLINIAFAIFNGCIGFISRSPWYITLAVYYFSLSCMRFWTVNYERRIPDREASAGIQEKEIRIYKGNSICLIFLTIVLGGMVILTIHSYGGRQYPGTVIYIVALYTFIKVPLAVCNWLRTAKMKTPLLVTIRSIGYADACVSILSLQTAMFAAFGDMEAKDIQALMNGITGGILCMLVLGMGIYGVHKANQMKIREE